MQTRNYNPSDTIFREGDDHCHEAYWVVSGRVAITVETENGDVELAQLKPGSLFGEMGLIDENPRSATATALEPTEVEVLDEETFEHAVLEQPERLRTYLKGLFERLRTADTLLQAEINRRQQGEKAGRSMESVLAEGVVVIRRGNGEARLGQTDSVWLRSNYEQNDSSQVVVDEEIDHFPYRIGRDVSSGMAPFVLNDLELPDRAPFSVSRNHCSIERHTKGFLVRDRGSSHGTVVNGDVLSVQSGHLVAQLHPGENEIIIGGLRSPHRFSVIVEKH